jgi:hypothetical protein
VTAVIDADKFHSTISFGAFCINYVLFLELQAVNKVYRSNNHVCIVYRVQKLLEPEFTFVYEEICEVLPN